MTLSKTLRAALLAATLPAAAHAAPPAKAAPPAAAPPAAEAKDRKSADPLVGDPKRGAQLHRLHCASCHGLGGTGDGFLAANLQVRPGASRSAELSVARSDDQLFKVVQAGGKAVGRSPAMPAFAGQLTDLEVWDVVAFLREGQLRTVDAFPAAGRVLASDFTLDVYALERLEKFLGVKVESARSTHQVLTVFNGPREQGVAPLIESHDPVTLDSLKARDRLGYLVVLPTWLPMDGRPVPTAFAMDSKGVLVKLLSVGGNGDDSKRDQVLAAYVGTGGKGPHKPLYPPGKAPKEKELKPGTPPPPLAAQKSLKGQAIPPADTLDGAYARAMEAVTMYDKEERERTWADSPSK